jgi:hypothetical protein
LVASSQSSNLSVGARRTLEDSAGVTIGAHELAGAAAPAVQ